MEEERTIVEPRAPSCGQPIWGADAAALPVIIELEPMDESAEEPSVHWTPNTTAAAEHRNGTSGPVQPGTMPREGTERKTIHRLETLLEENRKLMEANRRLREQDSFKSDFLSMASHELRTPLTIIKELIGVLRDGLVGSITPDQKECLDSAFESCGRLANLINDLLDLQKIESGRLRLKRRRCKLGAVLERCYRDFLPRFQAKAQTPLLEILDETLEVLCDEEKIIQVVINLLGNAHKFTPAGGAIVLRSFRKDREVVVEIEDSGPGISEEDHGRLFEKFIQLEREEGPGPKGTGLGLAIAKSILELHGGRIGVRSEVGKGSIFFFSFPVYQEEEELRILLEDRMQDVVVEGRRLQLILLRPEIDGTAGSPNPGLGMEEILSRIAAIASKVCRHRDDEVLEIPSEGLLAILTETNETGARAILARFFRLLGEKADLGIRFLHSSVRVLRNFPPKHWIALAKSRFERTDVALFGKIVLLVRSNSEGLEDVRKALTGSLPAVRTAVATNGCDAFVHLGKLSPDLVVLDVDPPFCDGRKILKKIQSCAGITESPKVILVTDREMDGEEVRRLGADACLKRPLEKDLLVQEADRLLRERSGSSKERPSGELVRKGVPS